MEWQLAQTRTKSENEPSTIHSSLMNEAGPALPDKGLDAPPMNQSGNLFWIASALGACLAYKNWRFHSVHLCVLFCFSGF